MKIIRLLIISIALSLINTACSQSDKPVLRLGTNIWPGYEPLYLAREKGFLSSDVVRLVEYPSASEVIRAFRNGALEMASLTLDEALMLIQDGIPLKVILVHDISNGADSILARPEIASMKDIRNKRVAVESGALGAYVITRALELNHLTINDIHLKHLDVNTHEQAYDNNDVDVVVNFEPVKTRLLNKGAHEIFSSKQIYGEIVDVMVVNEQAYAHNRESLKVIIDGWFAGLDYYRKNTAEAAGIMAKRLKVSPDEVIAGYHGIELPDRHTNMKLLGGNDPLLTETISKLSRVLKANKLLSSDLPDKSILTAEFI